MPYLKLIFGFFLLVLALMAFLFSPITAKTSEAHSIYCGVPPEPAYVLDNFNQQHTGPIPHHPATVTTTVSGTTVTVSWSATTGCYGWYEQPAGVTSLPASSWHYTTATSATFTGSCGLTYQPSVITIMNVDLTFAGYCCNIGHPANWNHSAATTDVNNNNSVSTVGNSVTITCFTITSLTAEACDGGPTQPVTVNWSGTPAGTNSFSIQRGTTSTSTVQIAVVNDGTATSYIDNGPFRPPSAGTYYYLVAAYSGASTTGSFLGNTGLPGPGASVASCFDYGLTNNGNITASQGTSGSNTITANLTVAPTQVVSFSASGLPAGTTAGFSPTSCNPTCSSTLTISTTASTPLGTYPITVTGSPLSRTTSFNLIVTGPPGPFSISPNPPTASCLSGNTPAITVSWTASSGATSYSVFRSNPLEGSPPGTPLPVAVGLTTTTYVDPTGVNNGQPGPTTGRTYQYLVRAINILGSFDTPWSSAVTARNCANPTVDLLANGLLGGFGGSITIPYGSSANLTWTSANATTCSASRSPTSSTWTGTKALNNTSPGESTGALTIPPSLYTYTLTCTNGNIPTSASNPASDNVGINVAAPLPWIQTTGGDVHSNTGINTPGGP